MEIADLFLVHNRPIVRHVDDSILRMVAGRELVLRRARGFAPLPMPFKASARTTLAVGAHLKDTVALAAGPQVFISQHIGDLEIAPALAAFQRVIADFEREPCRAAIGLLYEIFGDEVFEMTQLPLVRAFSANELRTLRRMLAQKLNAPPTSSSGRLFDAVASLIGLRQRSAFEGQAAMELEFALDGVESEQAYPVGFAKVIDWKLAVREIVANVRAGVAAGEIAAKFHNTLVEAIIEAACRAGETCVVLTGGCFQNKYLTERAVCRLRDEGFRPCWHQRVPPNDGGIALGQIVCRDEGHGRAAKKGSAICEPPPRTRLTEEPKCA